MDNMETYQVPAALTVLAGIFLAIGAICAITVTFDILWRRGWKSMMSVMIPVWIINATYMGPVTLFLYYRYGRPASTKPDTESRSCHQAGEVKKPDAGRLPAEQSSQDRHEPSQASIVDLEKAHCCAHKPSITSNLPSDSSPSSSSTPSQDVEKQHKAPASMEGMSHCHTSSSTRPMWATVLIGVSHCGAGCVLGDLVGEWLVYGTSASIRHKSIWAELLIDYAFALIFGIVFQYFSIAPMSGQYGPKTVWRAAKADVLSLTSFEIGAFGWMIAYQVGIWGYRLEMTTWAYWWMMQAGMAMGFMTAAPVNWWLISEGIKEPCC
ncbi:MAG: hypothetical protein Q9195_002934 [Heterodermia aff. obscurata]